jgi:hypothetical protein
MEAKQSLNCSYCGQDSSLNRALGLFKGHTGWGAGCHVGKVEFEKFDIFFSKLHSLGTTEKSLLKKQLTI